jgi:hypothetical protein
MRNGCILAGTKCDYTQKRDRSSDPKILLKVWIFEKQLFQVIEEESELEK